MAVNQWVWQWLGTHLNGRQWRHLVWWTQPKFVVSVAMVVVSGGDILWLRHTYRPHVPWGLPTGFVGHDESLEAACQRELWEETRLAVPDWHLLTVSVLPSRGHLEAAFSGVLPEGQRDGLDASKSHGEISSGQFFPVSTPPEPSLDTQRRLVGIWQEGQAKGAL